MTPEPGMDTPDAQGSDTSPSGDEVTQVGNPADNEGNHDETEVTHPKTVGTKATKLRVTDIERLSEYAVETDESPASILSRILDEYQEQKGAVIELTDTNARLQEANKEIREILKEEQTQHQEQFDEQVREIGELRARITTLENVAETAVVPTGGEASMDSFGVKDMIEEAKDMCGDDETCAKVMGKMIDLKAHFVSKASDQVHAAEQGRLDREQKELDRKSKEDHAVQEREFKREQAERDNAYRIELALAKKGGFRKEFLEDVVFLGGGSPKLPKKAIEQKKTQAMAEAEDDEEELLVPEDFDPEVEEELMVPEDYPEVE